ncbi:MAG TPA: hypothetical protein VHQ96_08160 [Gaiellaceae bacterium]|nr:hypothetical protein [Gaiellaceae bacterium]
MPHEVRLSQCSLVDDLVAVLRDAGATVSKRGRVLVVDDGDAAPERYLELVFFLRAWGVTHPGLTFEVVELAPGGP